MPASGCAQFSAVECAEVKMAMRLLPVLMLLCCGAAHASWVVVGDGNANSNSISNTVTVTCAAACDVGAYEQFNPGTGASIASAVCSSTGGGSPTAATSIPPPTTSSAETGLQYYCLNQAAGTVSVVITYTVSCQNILLVEAGTGGAHAIDGTGGTADSNNFGSTGPNTVIGKSVTTTVNGDLIMSFGNWVSGSTTLSVGTSPNAFTAVTNCNAHSGSGLCQFFVQPTAGTITPTMGTTNAGDNLTGTVAFQVSGAAPPSNSNMFLVQ